MLGIGVITFNRIGHLQRTIEAIQKYTTGDYCLIVADDNSRDKTIYWCAENNITVVTGKNHGVCWNKNRALAALLRYSTTDPIILLEDDCYPVQLNWHKYWIQATQKYHHMNYGPHPSWPRTWCVGGNGTPEEPYTSWEITGQATCTTREALEHVGYLNTQFRGYGYGHIEWTERFCKAGYLKREAIPCMSYGLNMDDAKTFKNMEDVHRNYWLAEELRKQPFAYCSPTQTIEEAEILKREIDRGIVYSNNPFFRKGILC